jgi:hypothetical protein
MSNSRIFQASYPAERLRGCKFATDFRDPLVMARDGWTSFGSPLYHPDGGVILNGTTQYLTRPLAGELNSANLTIHLEFWPTFAADDWAAHYLWDTPTAPGRFTAFKSNTNTITIRMGTGGTAIYAVPLASFQAYWLVNARNLLSLSSTTTASSLYLNGVLIATSPIAWTVATTTSINVGASAVGANFAGGRLGRLYIGHHTSTLAEHLAYWNRTMWTWEDRCTANLQFRVQDYDPTLVRTLDSSGHGNHFTLGDGVTPATYPTQGNGRMTFDGGDSLRYESMAQPTGAFSVCWCGRKNSTGASEYLSNQRDAGATVVAHILAWWNTQRFFFFVGGTATGYVYSSVHPITTKTVVGTWDGTTARLYVDGVLDVASTVGTPSQPSGAALAMRLGQTVAATSPFTGTMYDFKYLDGVALNQVQAYDYHHKMMSVIGSQL